MSLRMIRMPDKQETLEETLDKAFGVKGKVEAFDVWKKKQLHPPHAPTEAMKKVANDRVKAKIIAEKSSEYVPLTMNIDFEAIAKTTDFQRFIIFLAKKIMPGAFLGVSTRTNKAQMTKQFNQSQIDYTLVMNEMKQVLKLRREKKELNLL